MNKKSYFDEINIIRRFKISKYDLTRSKKFVCPKTQKNRPFVIDLKTSLPQTKKPLSRFFTM